MSRFGYLPRNNNVNILNFNELTGGTVTLDGTALEAPQSIIYLTQDKIDAGILDTDLDSTKLYIVDGALNITGYHIEIPVAGLQMAGWGFDISSITKTDINEAMFQCPVGGCGDLLLDDMGLTTSGTGGSVFAICDNDGTHAIEMNRVNFNGCTSLGFIEDYRQGLETGTGRFGGTPSLEFRGTWGGGYFIQTSIVRGVTDTTFSLFKCAVGQTFASRFAGNPNIFIPANATIYELTASNLLGDELFQLDGANFQGTGTIFDGIDETIPEVRITNTKGTPNTYVGGFWICSSAVATTFGPPVAGTFLKCAGTTTESDLTWFTGPGDNDLTVNTTTPLEVTALFTGSFNGGNNKLIIIKFRIWDDSASSYVDDGQTTFTTNGTGRFESVTLISPRLSLEEGDRVELWITNVTDTTSITMEVNSALQIREA